MLGVAHAHCCCRVLLTCSFWFLHTGSNEYGKCGTGTAPPEGPYRYTQPVAMAGGGNWSDIAAMSSATLGILRGPSTGLPASPLPSSPSPAMVSPGSASPVPSPGDGGQPGGPGEAASQESSTSSAPIGAIVGAVVGALGERWQAHVLQSQLLARCQGCMKSCTPSCPVHIPCSCRCPCLPGAATT